MELPIAQQPSNRCTAVEATSTNTSKDRSSTTRKRKIGMGQINKDDVIFLKRKLGLFNKVTELSILCQAETALIVTSQNGELYTCGYPTPDTVICRFLTRVSHSECELAEKQKQKESVETFRVQYEAAQEILKEERKRRDKAMEANKALMGFPSWWEYSIDEMGLEELEQFKASLEHLKINLMATMEQKRVNSIQPIPFPSMLPTQMSSNFSPILSGTLCTKQEQAWAWRNNGVASSSKSGSLGTWDWRNNDIVSSSNSSLLPNVDFGYYCHN